MSSGNNDKIKVLMLAASLPPLPAGGAEIQALKLGEALGRKGLSVSFITPGKGAINRSDTIKGMPVYRLHSFMSRLFTGLSGLKKRRQRPQPTRIEYDDNTEPTRQISSKVGWPTVVFYNIFFFHSLFFLWRRRRSFDLIHAHTMEWSAIVAVRLGRALGKPVLIKDSTMNGFASLARFPSGARLQKMIIRRAHFVAMTRVIGDNLRMAGIPAEKISLIPNGIAINEPAVAATPAPAAAPSAATPAPSAATPAPSEISAPQVLFVGNLYQQPAKGVDILLKAWARVTRQHPAAILQIVGDGDLPAYLDYAASLGIGNTVRFYGKQSGLAAYYSAATLFVLPSRREGMSNALMEAMLQGLPCVATNISGSQDLIESGTNGLLVPPMDIAQLADAIGYLLDHPREALEMGKRARTAILQKTDIDVVADHYVSLYKSLIIFR